MLDVIFESFWLWYLTGVALWAFLGVLAASRQGLSTALGCVIGGVFWFVGVAGLLTTELLRRSRSVVQGARTMPVAESSYPASPPAAATPAWGQGVGTTTTDATDEWGWPGDLATAGRPAVAGLITASQPKRVHEVSWPVVMTAFAALATVGMFVSIVSPWGAGRVAWANDQRHASGSVSPTSIGIVAALIAVSATVLLACVVAAHRRPRGLWLAIAALITTWWFALVSEWALVASDASSTIDHGDNLGGSTANASIGSAYGAWIMLASCVAIYVWCAYEASTLLRRRVTAAPASVRNAF